MLDARWFQIAFLLSLLGFGTVAREFSITSTQLALTLASCLATQASWQWGLRLPTRSQWTGYLSAIVSAAGICILVRAENLWAHPLLACVAMSSKFLLRAGPRACRSHIFNPANLAAFLALTAMPGTWLSPGQWGSDVLLALWILALGGVVTRRIARWDVSLTFLGVWGVLLAARLVWFEYDWQVGHAIWLQQISNGATLLFAFFMISDPMTTPQHAGARMGYAAAVASGAFVCQYVLFRPHGLIVTLAIGSMLVPVANTLWCHKRFEWSRRGPLSKHAAQPL